MKRHPKESETGSIDWHTDNYRGPIRRMRFDDDAIPDLILTHRNTQICRFIHPRFDHLRVEDLLGDQALWLIKSKKVGENVLKSLESQEFPVCHSPSLDPITEDWFLAQMILSPSEYVKVDASQTSEPKV